MKIYGLLTMYNDEDIIQEVIEYYISQNISLIILDNGSTDKSFQIAKKFENYNSIEVYQDSSTTKINDLYNILYQFATKKDPDWFITIASDEFLETGIPNVKLDEAISKVDKEGHNLIQFDRFDFFMSDMDDQSQKSVKTRLKYYSYQDDFVYRAWKNVSGTIPHSNEGHFPVFPSNIRYRIPSQKFVLRHYPFRSMIQAKKRIIDRMKRSPQSFIPTKKKIPHYLRVLNTIFSGYVDHTILSKYEENNIWNRERKYTPYVEDHPKREELFSDDGKLILHWNSNMD